MFQNGVFENTVISPMAKELNSNLLYENVHNVSQMNLNFLISQVHFYSGVYTKFFGKVVRRAISLADTEISLFIDMQNWTTRLSTQLVWRTN